MNIKSIALIMDLSSLNRCMSVNTCSKCIFYDSYGINSCNVGVLLKNNSFVDWYDHRVIGILFNHCYQNTCKKCIFKGKNLVNGCNRISITKNVITQKWRT